MAYGQVQSKVPMGGIGPQPPPQARPSPSPYNPAERDVALRSLGSPQPVATPPIMAPGQAPQAAAAPVAAPAAEPVPMDHEAWLDARPDHQAIRGQMHAASPEERRKLASDFRDSMHAWLDTMPDHVGRSDRSGFSDSFDSFENGDQQPAPAEPTGGDEAARIDAARIKRLRQSRLGG